MTDLIKLCIEDLNTSGCLRRANAEAKVWTNKWNNATWTDEIARAAIKLAGAKLVTDDFGRQIAWSKRERKRNLGHKAGL